ncbi:MAG: hypothetical protein HeimC3_55350 [Candidatus Heimdallarchaeota archaeon LC_3]|nr:MAG: hypothetical protein HeimC3_55350 [Candidatus Heimdallarchaeota archaeon LC_3]
MLITNDNTAFGISIISGFRVRNKTFLGFALVVIVFGVGIVVRYNASQTITDTNKQVLE